MLCPLPVQPLHRAIMVLSKISLPTFGHFDSARPAAAAKGAMVTASDPVSKMRNELGNGGLAMIERDFVFVKVAMFRGKCDCRRVAADRGSCKVGLSRKSSSCCREKCYHRLHVKMSTVTSRSDSRL